MMNNYTSLRDTVRALKSKDISATEIVDEHFSRINAVNPHVNAVVTFDEENARRTAQQIDNDRIAGKPLPPLAGVPMTHKDTHEVSGIRTTWGSPIYKDHVSHTDDLIIARMREAGVITTGKTNVPEFAAGAHTFNPVFGTTLNPYNTAKSAAGSSGGAAVVIAAGVQAAGDGSDMGGSLRFPASFNNIAGLRPSNGWLPHLAPKNPYGWIAQSGFMAREVADIALLMKLTSRPHPAGPVAVPPGSSVAWDDALTAEDLTGVRVGFSTDLGGRVQVDAEVRQVIDAQAEVFAGLGAHVTAACPNLDLARRLFRLERAFEFAFGFSEPYKLHGDLMKESLRTNIEAGLAMTPAEHFERVRLRGNMWPALVEFFATHDVFVCTTSQVLPFDASQEFPTHINGEPMEDYLSWMESATLISATGCPAISVPAGFSEDGLPVGVQIVGRPAADAHVLRVAAAYEAATKHAWQHPKF
ncbi:amidase [uncultured Brevibacterium sp.]|uniref:amidase n=1 Tax=uncultured Brevibacterium sp. TaxID=189678 RepID=UPI0025FB02F9|nr:amidase family protein [uncultured Brevibacterium sp.]